MISLLRGSQPDGFEHTRVFYFGKRIEQFCLLGGRGMRSHGRRTGNWNRTGGFQLIREDEFQQPFLQAQQGNFIRAHTEDFGYRSAEFFRRVSLCQCRFHRGFRSPRRRCCRSRSRVQFSRHIVLDLSAAPRVDPGPCHYRDLSRPCLQVTEVLSDGDRVPRSWLFTPWSEEIPFHANRECRHPWKLPGCSPFSAGCRQPEPSGSHRRSTGSWVCSGQEHAPQCRAL